MDITYPIQYQSVLDILNGLFEILNDPKIKVSPIKHGRECM